MQKTTSDTFLISAIEQIYLHKIWQFKQKMFHNHFINLHSFTTYGDITSVSQRSWARIPSSPKFFGIYFRYCFFRAEQYRRNTKKETCSLKIRKVKTVILPIEFCRFPVPDTKFAICIARNKVTTTRTYVEK